MKVARNDEVGRDELLAFVRDRHQWVLTTRRRDDRLQQSLVTGGVDDGRLVVSTYPDRAKTVNIRRNPAVSVVVQSDAFGGDWVQVDGTAEVVDGEEGVEGLVRYYQAVAGDHDDWDAYRRAMRDRGKVLLRITIDGWGPIASGGVPPRFAER